jgi:hypothetical protein
MYDVANGKGRWEKGGNVVFAAWPSLFMLWCEPAMLASEVGDPPGSVCGLNQPDECGQFEQMTCMTYPRAKGKVRGRQQCAVHSISISCQSFQNDWQSLCKGCKNSHFEE